MTAAIAISETAFLSQILELAAMLGYEGAHFRPALTGRGWRTPVQGSLGKGFPDLVLARPADGRLLFVELKSDTGKVSPEQQRVLDVLAMTAGEVFVWRPRDFEAIALALR